MKLRYFYKINHKKEPIPGSNIRRKSRPKPYSQWKEITPVCCNPDDIDCTCGPRFWVQIDGTNKPVDGTLIKRDAYPLMAENIRYQEVQAPNCCALITWQFHGLSNGSGNMKIYDNGVLIVDDNVIPGDEHSGQFRPSSPTSSIHVIITNESAGVFLQNLNITGGHTYNDTGDFFTGVIDYTFAFNNTNTNIYGEVNGTDR